MFVDKNSNLDAIPLAINSDGYIAMIGNQIKPSKQSVNK